MITKMIKKYFLDTGRDMHERLFLLIAPIMLISWILMLIELLATGGSFADIMNHMVCIIICAAASFWAVKNDRLSTGAAVISAVLVLIYLPMTFFFSGGVYSDVPVWFLFAIVFINMSLNGRARSVMLSLHSLAAAFCWVVSYFFPELVIGTTRFNAYLYSVVTIVLAGMATTIMVSVQTSLYSKELELSRAQKKEIEALSASQARFFSSMSHEIRTPINTIIGLNEMILREDISDEVAEDAANVSAASKMLLHLINDILDMSKLESGQMQLTPAEYHPGDMLSELVGMLWLRAKEKGLEFTVSVAPDLPAELTGDEVRIKQILINVLNNAIKYTKEGSVSLSVQCGERSGSTLNVIYTVSDTGMGIKKEDIPYLFTAFRRFDENSNRHIEGTGLGLSIVKQFVDLMNGKITVNSVYTKGSTFIIEIPQQFTGEQSIGEVDLKKSHERGRRVIYHQKFEAPDAKVLVVDDNASNLLVVTKLLRDTRVNIDTAESGAEALKMTLNTEYHVIFMDHLMPEMDGIECHRSIRTQVGGLCRNSRIVALTANAGSESRALYEKEGFDGCLVKPISGDELERELCRLLPKDIVYLSDDRNEIYEETISWLRSDRKKKKIVITTESVADLPQELIDRYGIVILPHKISTGSGTFRDGSEVETTGLLNYMRDESRRVETRPPDVREHEEFFAEQLAAANNIIHISISSQVANSGCPAAKEAAAAFDNVTVIDTGHLSSGQGFFAVEASRLAEAGKTPAEIAESLEKLKNKVHTSFVVENLDFLARAGQISRHVADLTMSFMVRPVLELKKGKIGISRVFFGTKEEVWKKYIDDVLRDKENIDDAVLFITYVGLTNRELESIKEYTESRMHFRRIYFQQSSPAIAVNCGAGTFGLLLKYR